MALVSNLTGRVRHTDSDGSYTDADTIVMNQEIPLSIFEPPGDFNHVKWIAGRDWNGLNAGIFFLRVDTWSLNLLNRVMTYKHYHPTEDYTFEEQSILARLTEQNDEFKTQAIYMPRMWFNAYVSYKEEHPGLFMAHFPDAGHKWHMYKWLRIAEVRNGLNRTSIDHMPLPYIPNLQEISNFWAARRRADEVLKQLEGIAVEQATIGVNHENIRLWVARLRDAQNELSMAVERKTDDYENLAALTEQVEKVMIGAWT